MNLQDLFNRRDVLLAELTVVRADIKLAKAKTASDKRQANSLYAKRHEALALRRSGMKYLDIAKAIGSSSAAYTQRMITHAKQDEKWEEKQKSLK